MSSIHKPKQVKFDDSVNVFHQTGWSEDDYVSARRGPWMMYALDSHRFQRRINEASNIIDPVLDDNHRLIIRLRNMTLDP